MTDKADYVRSQRQNRNHTCHWPGCDRQVPPAMWGCKPHWFKLPKRLRDLIWATYEIGQEVTMTPSEAYLDAAHEVQVWIDEQRQSDGVVATSSGSTSSNLGVGETACTDGREAPE